MAIPAETIDKMQALPSDKANFVISLVDQLSMAKPIDIFEALRQEGTQNPMTENEVDEFITSVRKDNKC